MNNNTVTFDGVTYQCMDVDSNLCADTCAQCAFSYTERDKDDSVVTTEMCTHLYNTNNNCYKIYWVKKPEPFTFAQSCMLSDFDRKMKPLTDELMTEYDIPNRFNGTGKYPLHLTNIEAVVRQALYIGFLHGKGFESK